jgi:hypothetical protein
MTSKDPGIKTTINHHPKRAATVALSGASAFGVLLAGCGSGSNASAPESTIHAEQAHSSGQSPVYRPAQKSPQSDISHGTFHKNPSSEDFDAKVQAKGLRVPFCNSPGFNKLQQAASQAIGGQVECSIEEQNTVSEATNDQVIVTGSRFIEASDDLSGVKIGLRQNNFPPRSLESLQAGAKRSTHKMQELKQKYGQAAVGETQFRAFSLQGYACEASSSSGISTGSCYELINGNSYEVDVQLRPDPNGGPDSPAESAPPISAYKNLLSSAIDIIQPVVQ